MISYLEQYYREFKEDERLLSRAGQVEYRTTMKYIHDYLRNNKQHRILEIGAGTGRYCLELCKEGYRVDAIELLDCNIEIIKSKLEESDKLNIQKGNALDLYMYDDNTFDITLVLGPLYHLCEEEDKLQVLREAIRVTKNSGYIFAAYCMNEAVVIQEGFMRGNANEFINLSDDFHCINVPQDVFAMVRIEDVYQLTNNLPVEREKIISTDGASNYIRERLDKMETSVFEQWIKYHFSICERMDLIGATNHSLDILKKVSG